MPQNRRAFAVALLAITCFMIRGREANAVPVPMLDLDFLVTDSTLVVTGAVISLNAGPPQRASDGAGTFEARPVTGTIEVKQFIKGGASTNQVQFTYLLPEEFRGWRSVALQQYAMFFLKPENGHLRFVSSYYPYISVAPGVAGVGATPVDRVISVVSGTASDAQATEQQRQSAIRILAAAKEPAAATRLRELLNSGPLSLRVATAAALLRKNDLSGMALVTQVLLQKPQNVSETVLADAVAAVRLGVSSRQAITQLEQLLASGDPDVRRASTAALIRTNALEATKPLLSELEDSDFETRYFAAVGLAQITGQPQWRPTIDQFQSGENKYLRHWKEWQQNQHDRSR
jgi:hypothetical protein